MKKIIIIALFFTIGGSVKSDNNMVCKDGVCHINKSASIEKEENNSASTINEDCVTTITIKNFDSIVKKSTKPVIIDFYATWCKPCKQVKPIFNELAKEKTDWVFVSVDVDQVPTVAAEYGIQAMPTFVIVKNGIKWGSIKGALPKEKLNAELEKIVNLPAPDNKSDQTEQLIMAIFQKDMQAIKNIIAKEIDVNQLWESPQGNYYPIQAAITAGTEEIIDILINSGAKVDSNIQAAIKKQMEIAENAQKGLQEAFEYTKNKLKNTKVTKKKDGLSVADESDLNNKFIMAIHDISVLKKLIEDGADVNRTFLCGPMTIIPLYFAVLLNKKDAIDLLVDAGALLTIEVSDIQGCKKTVEELIKSDIETYNEMRNKIYKQLDYAIKKYTTVSKK